MKRKIYLSVYIFLALLQVKTVTAQVDESDLSIQLLEQLRSVNMNWYKYQADNPVFSGLDLPLNEKELISTHLSLVTQILNQSGKENYNTSQFEKRQQLLTVLSDYARRGIFPVNTYEAQRIPVFIDSYGTYCAVGFLLKESGEKGLALDLQKQYNLSLLKEMADDRILPWADEWGFSFAELAFIQPTYDYQYPVVNKPDDLPLVFTRNSRAENRIIDRFDILERRYVGQAIFTGSKPYFVPEYLGAIYHDSDSKQEDAGRKWLVGNYDPDVKSQKPVLRYFYTHPYRLYDVKTENFQLAINPVLHFEVGNESATTGQNNYINTRGVEVMGSIANKVGFYSFIGENQGNYPLYIDTWVNGHKKVFPGEGRSKPFKTHGLDYMAANGYVVAKPIKEIALQFGHGRNFIGHGYRSLILSDFARDYLFLKINTRVWKLHYQNLFTEMVDHRDNDFSESLMPRKYGAFHQLSFMPLPNLEIGVFEGVVFGQTDSLINRSFELQYLNPIIFYRAVEFHIGSPDNVLIGLQWKYNFLRHFQFFGQLMFDEFKYWELLKNTGWWANKYGLQAGLKYMDIAGIHGLDLHVEYNQVRPYTFSHDNPSASYSHYYQPLAHPLGANLKEWIGMLNYQPLPNLWIETKIITTKYGSDTAAMNYGGNIFISNATHHMDYNNKTLQGIANSLLYVQASLTYMLKPNLFADALIIHRSNDSLLDELDTRTNYFGLALRYNFARREYPF